MSWNRIRQASLKLRLLALLLPVMLVVTASSLWLTRIDATAAANAAYDRSLLGAIKALDVNGQKVHHVGIPIHWGFKGVTQNGYLANALTPFVGDANSQTPEFKAFLVNIEKA